MWKLFLHLQDETCQGFPNSIRGVGEKSPVPVGMGERRGGMGNFGEGREFFIGW